MSHSDICNTSYGRKKGRESNWQFDSQPQKVNNQPDPSVCKWSATHHWKALKESYKLASNLILIRGLSQELWVPKVPRVQPECRNPSFGLATKAKGLQRCGPRGSPGATSYTSGSVGKCEGVFLTLLGQFPLWEMESRRTPETSKSNLRAQNSMACVVLYIIGKLLERKCLNRLALFIWTSKTQIMDKRRAGSQTANLCRNPTLG